MRIVMALAVPLMLVALAGCGGGGSTAKVSGKVTTGGKPVTGASICFSSQGGASSCGVLNARGEYEITIGLKPGSHKVYLFVPSTPDPPPMSKEPATAAPASSVPPKYLSDATSGLTAELNAGDNPDKDFALD